MPGPATAPRVDPLVTAVLVLAVVCTAGYPLDRAGPAAQAGLLWLVLTALHAAFTVAAVRVVRLAAAGSAVRAFWRTAVVAGVAYLAGDALMLADVARDPLGPQARIGSTAQVVAVSVGTLALIAGLLRAPRRARSPGALSRLRLDTATVMAAATTFGFYLSALPPGRVDAGWVVQLAVTVAVAPGIFLVAVFAVVRTVLGGAAPLTRAAGTVCCLAAALQAVLQGVPDGVYRTDPAGLWLSGANVLASALLAVGGRMQERRLAADRGWAPREPRRPYSLLPYAAIVATYLLLVYDLAAHGLTARAWLVLGGAVVSCGLVLARQLAAFRHVAELLAERDALAARLHDLAFHDALTGLANRVLFRQRLAAALAAGPAAVFLVDLDDFKPVNDRYGHAAGDALLVEAGRRLRARVRAADTVARLGGDEFAVLVPGADDAVRTAVAAALRDALSGTVRIGAAEVPLRGSVGSAGGAGPAGAAGGADDLLHRADLDMYAAKSRAKRVRSGPAPPR